MLISQFKKEMRASTIYEYSMNECQEIKVYIEEFLEVYKHFLTECSFVFSQLTLLRSSINIKGIYHTVNEVCHINEYNLN